MTLATALTSSLLLLAPQQSPSSGDKLLATIPDGIAVLRELVFLNNRTCFTQRTAIAWSADGKTVAYAGRRGDHWVPVVNGQVGAKFVYVSIPQLAGGHAFFRVARDVKANEQHNWIWVDGDLVGPEDWMADFSVSCDGKRLAYWTLPGAKVGAGAPGTDLDHVLCTASQGAGGRWTVARGGKWKICSMVQPVFATDGKSLFTGAANDKGWTVLQATGRSEKALCDPLALLDSFAVSGDGKAIAYLATNAITEASGPRAGVRDAPELWFKGARTGKGFAAISACAVDPTGAHVAYVVDVENRRSVAVDSESAPAGAWDHIGEIAFDAGGTALAFAANVGGALSNKTPGLVEGGAWLVVARKLGNEAAPAQRTFLEVRDLVWDPSGARVAYAARDEAGWHLVCGEAVSAAHTDVGRPSFSADGKTIGFGTRDKSELYWRSMNLP